MTVTRFFTPEWTASEVSDNRVTLAGIIEYVHRARAGHGLDDQEIAEDIETQWPGLFPGGPDVRTTSTGMVWISSRSFDHGAPVKGSGA